MSQPVRRLCATTGTAMAADCLARVPPLLRRYLARLEPLQRPPLPLSFFSAQERREALHGMEVVLGVNAEVVEFMHQRARHSYSREMWEPNKATDEVLRSWRNIRRGRDMFISGLPRFNIEEAYESCVPFIRAPCLTEVMGIGRARMQMLHEVGITAADELAALTRHDEAWRQLRQRPRVGDGVIERLVADARDLERSRFRGDLAHLLVSVPKIQAAGHFPQLSHDNGWAMRIVSKVLSLEADCPESGARQSYSARAVVERESQRSR